MRHSFAWWFTKWQAWLLTKGKLISLDFISRYCCSVTPVFFSSNLCHMSISLNKQLWAFRLLEYFSTSYSQASSSSYRISSRGSCGGRIFLFIATHFSLLCWTSWKTTRIWPRAAFIWTNLASIRFLRQIASGSSSCLPLVLVLWLASQWSI